MYSFEFDRQKSESNLNKHGIDFVQAQALWDDPNSIEIQAKSDDEPRSLLISNSQFEIRAAMLGGTSSSSRDLIINSQRASQSGKVW